MRYKNVYFGLLAFALVLIVTGLVFGTPSSILPGLYRIIITEDTLITDYIQIAGIGAAFVNAALVLLITLGILVLSKDVVNGFTIAECGLMAGFALFGKNIVNIWPILLGTWLYARYRKEPFSKYVGVGLLATSLAPLVSFVALYKDNPLYIPLGFFIGVVIGFLLPSLSAYTYKIQNGMNIYNVGFACGILALILVPLLQSIGMEIGQVHYWATGLNLPFGVMLGVLCLVLILLGSFFCKRPPREAWRQYFRLLKTSGRAPSDYLRMFDEAPVLINMGVNGLIATAYILITGGDLNGPTLGGIFTIMGFAAYGKHAFNIVPVMAGVALGGSLMRWELSGSTMQLAGLFGTALAPIAGHFGWPYGLLAGFLHSAAVLYAGIPASGMNLYNNGFAAGILAIVLYPTITAIARHRKPVLQDHDYFDVFESASPVDVAPSARRRPQRSGEEAAEAEAYAKSDSAQPMPEAAAEADEAKE